MEPVGGGGRVCWHESSGAADDGTGTMADGSFEEFYDASYGRLLRQLVLVTGDRGDAEDLLQDAYGRAGRWPGS